VLVMVWHPICSRAQDKTPDKAPEVKEDNPSNQARGGKAAKTLDLSKLPMAMQALLLKIDAKAAGIKDVRADFQQHKHTPLLKKPLISSGRILIKGKTMRWDTLKPRHSVMLVGAKDLKLFYPEDKVLEIYDLSQKMRHMTASPIPRLEVMTQHFEIQPPSKDKAEKIDYAKLEVLELSLLPKDASLKKHIAHAQVLIDVKTAFCQQMHFVDVDGDRTILYFRNIKLNIGLKDAELKLNIPDRTRISRPLKPAKASSKTSVTPKTPAKK
jgi:outer membrane lipoprotein-sorting protein